MCTRYTVNQYSIFSTVIKCYIHYRDFMFIIAVELFAENVKFE